MKTVRIFRAVIKIVEVTTKLIRISYNFNNLHKKTLFFLFLFNSTSHLFFFQKNFIVQRYFIF